MIRLCGRDEVQADEPLRVVLDGHAPLAVFRVGDDIFVTDDTCTHGQASLAEYGELDGFTIVCTWHDGAFDLRTGDVVQRPCTEKLRTYTVTIREDAVFIDP